MSHHAGDNLRSNLFNASNTSRGLGLRRGFLSELQDYLAKHPKACDFLEVAPENWVGIGGRFAKQFSALAEQYPITLHGLSLNIGGFAPLDKRLLQDTKAFMARYNCPFYSDHLSYCADDAQLYDLMPIPFTEEAVKHVAARIKQVQDVLERRIAIENVSYYAAPHQAMDEVTFINAVLAEADCDLLLDVNNIHVNSINHGYDPSAFLKAMPKARVAYIHVAGHYHEAEDLRVDTHGSDVINEVWQLLALAYEHVGLKPTLLERDFNFPPMAELFSEVERITKFQQAYLSQQAAEVV